MHLLIDVLALAILVVKKCAMMDRDRRKDLAVVWLEMIEGPSRM